MFGREPQLPVDGKFGIQGLNPQFQVLSKYSSNLQKRLQSAFKAAREAQDKASAWYAQYYDTKARAAVLGVGDLVLVIFDNPYIYIGVKYLFIESKYLFIKSQKNMKGYNI